MQLNEIKKIAIIGAGTMGSGIAQVSALAGYETILFDIEPPKLKARQREGKLDALKEGQIQ